MSKNDVLSYSLETVGNITKDENFKDIVRYKAIAALLVKFAIPEFRDESISNIARLIVDNRKRKENMSDTEILEDEVDFLASEAGTKDEKNIISDAIFKLRVDNEISEVRFKHVDITVNTEMQKIVSEGTLKYNIVSRAIYYGASLLRNTVPAGDTSYAGIHKVYTIWFCARNLELEEYTETIGQYIHRYGFRRFYDGIDKTVKPESFADLIEVVLVELKKLKEQDNETTRMVYTLFNDTMNVVNLIEASEKVNLTKVRKGVTAMIDYEARTKQRVEEAVREAVREAVSETEGKGELKVAKNLVESLKAKNPNASYTVIIKETASLLKLDANIVEKLQQIYGVGHA